MDHSDALLSDAELNSVRQMARAYAERQLDTAPAAQSLRDHALRATRDWQGSLGAVEQLRAMAIGRDSLDAFSLSSSQTAWKWQSDLGAFDRLCTTAIARDSLDDFLRPSLDALSALAHPSPELRAWAAGSVFANVEERQRESMDALMRSVRDAQQSVADSLDLASAAGSLETGTLGASARSALDARESIAEQWRASALAFSEAIQPTETLLAGWRKSLRRNEGQLRETTKLLLESPVKPGRGVGSQQALTPASPSFPADTPLRRDLGLADGIFRGSEARQGLLADSVLSRCLDDIQLFFDHGRPVSAIDRAHSALHRVLQLLAEEVSQPSPDPRKVRLLCNFVCTYHPVLSTSREEARYVNLAEQLSEVVGGLTRLRNAHSLAHPTDDLPPDPVARFFVRQAVTVIHLVAEQHARDVDGLVHNRYRYN